MLFGCEKLQWICMGQLKSCLQGAYSLKGVKTLARELTATRFGMYVNRTFQLCYDNWTELMQLKKKQNNPNNNHSICLPIYSKLCSFPCDT